MERVETVLGENWANQAEGKELKELGENFEKHINVTIIADKDIKEMQQFTADLHFQERIFDIQTRRRTNQLELVVNFNEVNISLFKEIRNFAWMGHRVPFTLQFKSEEVQNIYPSALSLQESLQIFNQVTNRIDDKFAKLVVNHKKEVLNTLQAGVGMAWNFKVQLQKYIKTLADRVNALEDVVNTLNEKVEQIYSYMNSLTTAKLTFIELNEKMQAIQGIVDDFSLLDVSNLSYWVQDLDAKIEAILSKRLVEVIN